MKHLVEGLPHHVPIRKENRWEAILHYATAPNTAVAAVPTRRSGISELIMPERQESVSSYISQYSSQNGQSISCNSLPTTTSSSREEDGDSFSPRQLKMHNGIVRTNMLKTQEIIPSLLSSPRARNSTYTSERLLSSKSLFSRNSLNTTFEEKEEDTDAYRVYTMHLSNYMSSPPLDRCPQAKSPSKLDDWFQHSDDSSASKEENPSNLFSGRTSTIPVIDECYNESAGTNSTDNYCTSETEVGTISETTEASPETDRIENENNKRPIHTSAAAPPTANTVRRVLHDSAPPSTNASKSSDETTTSESGYTKLDRLREKMKTLRERRALSFSQSTQSSNAIPENIETRFQNPSLHRTQSFLQSTNSINAILNKNEQKNQNPSLHSIQSFSQSTNLSKTIPRKIEQETQNQSYASSLSLESQPSSGRSEKTINIRGNSRCDRKARPIQPPKAPKPIKTVSKAVMKNLQKELTTEASPPKKSLVPLTSCSFAPIAEEAEESLKAEMKHDAHIHITGSSSCSEEAAESLEITNSSSFASSKCTSIAEEAVESLRAERLQITSSSSSSSFGSSKRTSIAEEAVTERKYDSHVHITRQYSMKQMTEEESPRPARSSLVEEKAKRAGRRPGSSRLASKLEADRKRGSSRSMTLKLEAKPGSEPKNLVDELKEAVTARGPLVPAEEELQHPWSDPFQSEWIEPLASKDSLSTQSPPGSPPRSFRERRLNYLKNIGDSEQSRTPKPFTSVNFVLGSLPQNLPAPRIYCPLQGEEEIEEAKDSFSRENETKTSRSRSPKKWMTRKNVRKNMKKDVENAGKLSPGRVRKSWMPRQNVLKEKEEKQSKHATPLHESRQNNPHKPNWAQRSFVNRFASSLKEKDDTKRSSSRRTSSGRLTRSTSNSSKGKEREGISRKSPSRHLVRSKSSKEKEKERLVRNASFSSRDKSIKSLSRKSSSRNIFRNISNSSKDKSIKSLSREASSKSLFRNISNSSKDKSIKSLSREASSRNLFRNISNSSKDKSIKCLSREASSKSLFRNISNSSRDKSIKSFSKEPSSRRLLRNTSNSSKGPSSRRPVRSASKSSVDKDIEGSPRKPSSRRPVRSASKSSMDKEKEGSYRKPSSRRLIGKRDNNRNAKIDTENPSLGKFGSTIRKSSKNNDNPKKPSSGRFGAASRNSDKDKDKGSTKNPSSRRFGVNRFASSSSKEKEGLTSTKQQQQQPPSRRLEVIDKRDDSYNSLSSSIKPSSRRAGAKSSRDHSHKSYTTIGSDRSGSGSSNIISNIIHNVDSPSKHGRRTRPRTPTSQRSVVQRMTRYKDYRKNGVLVTEHKRFHVDMSGGIV